MRVLGAVLALSPYWFTALLVLGTWLSKSPPVETVRTRRELGWCLRDYRERIGVEP